MAIDEEQVLAVARLARLTLEPTENQRIRTDLQRILDMVEALQSAPADEVEPMAHPLDAVQRMRPDRVTETDQRQELMRGAPLARDGWFLVPRVIE